MGIKYNMFKLSITDIIFNKKSVFKDIAGKQKIVLYLDREERKTIITF